MIYGDYHTHTQFCDGKNTAEEMVQSAIEKGLKYYGFSSHSYLACDDAWTIKENSQDDYIKETGRLKEKYKDKISLLIGTEFDLLCENDLREFDYVIGSCHSLIKNGEYLSVDHSLENFINIAGKFYDNDFYALVKEYYGFFETAKDVKEITFYGHFDLIGKYNIGFRFFNEDCREYDEPMYSCLEVLAKTGKPFEINTKLNYKHAGNTHLPSCEKWLKALKEMGGQIMINSDAHTADRIGADFDRAEALARKCGFNSRLVLTPAGFDELKF